jgi:carbon storage regulator CsrA
MLVLARKLDETIRIGDHITVTILQVKGRIVKIGITAPRDIRVMRGELIEAADEASSTVQFETTLDIDQLNALGGAAESGLNEATESGVAAETCEKGTDEKRSKSTRGLSGFRRARELRSTHGQPSVAGALAAAN